MKPPFKELGYMGRICDAEETINKAALNIKILIQFYNLKVHSDI